jgi:hypothetical protein
MNPSDALQREGTNQKIYFDPQVTRAMALAFDRACHALGLEDQGDPITSKLIADTIIDFAQCGERDPDQLWAMTMHALT